MRVQRISPPEKPCVCAQSGDGFTSASSPTRSLTLGRWDCGERTIQSLSWQRFQLVNQRQYARHISLSCHLCLQETVLAFVRENFVSQGMIADVAFHHMDKTNPHAHIMLTTRAVGPAGFGGKVRDWNDRTHAETWRASWADHANRALANAG